MKKIFTLAFFSLLLFSSNLTNGQSGIGYSVPGTICQNPDCSDIDQVAAKTQNGNGSIAVTYTVTACGLGYVATSTRLNQRSFGCCGTGAAQPAPITVTGLPACFTPSNVSRAFLYCGVSGNGIGITATIANSSTTQNFPMTMIGSHFDKCWGYVGTYNYRADVTSIINGNGSYTISGLPSVVGTNDTDGATLIIIYRDPTQTYTGSFIIADGCVEGSGSWVQGVNGFNVCGATNSQSNFMIVTDLQKIAAVPFKMNSAVDNVTWPIASQNVYDFVSANVAACTSGQTSATFGITTSGDCWNIVAAGMYYRTSCLACAGGPCVLPLELLSFDAGCSDEGISLKWETATEKDVKNFTVLRSENSRDFSPIAIIPATNKNTNSSYSYGDKKITGGQTYYYKLTETEMDGKVNDIGETKSVACRKKFYQVELSPNPVENEVTISCNENLNNATIKIVDQLGQTVKTFSDFSLDSNGKANLDIHELKNGFYQLIIINGGNMSRQRFVVYK